MLIGVASTAEVRRYFFNPRDIYDGQAREDSRETVKNVNSSTLGTLVSLRH